MKKPHVIGLAVLIVAVFIAVYGLFREQPSLATTLQLPLDDLLQNTSEFSDPNQSWPYRFPTDHGLHSDYRAEYWLFAGILKTEDDNTFGFQIAFMRLALSANTAERTSAWSSRQVYRAHLALVDTTTKQATAYERYSREALGLSGAAAEPFTIWLENWSVRLEDNRITITAAEQNLALNLQLQTSIAPAVLDDDSESTALHGYLLPRLQVQGTIHVNNREKKVISGDAMLDHAWGRLPIARGQLTLNRLLLQMDSGDDIRCLQLRRRDGSGSPITSCQWWNEKRDRKQFGRREITLVGTTEWQSSTAISYPVTWDLHIPSQQAKLAITPLLEAQELDFGIRLWAGLVQVSGQIAGIERHGYGYLELSGYAK